MPCDTQLSEARIASATDRLKELLASGDVKVRIGTQGAVAFDGWTQGAGGRVSDVCAYRRLMASNCFALKQAVAKAEAMSGRKVAAAAVAAGTHSHDGGETWNKGH